MKNLFLLIVLDILASFYVVGQRPLKGRDSTIKGPQTFAIIVGISRYKFVRSLSYADKDAELFRDYLKSPAGGTVPGDNIFCLLNEEAICSNFWSKGFQWLKAKNLRKGDRLFIYLAGHGDAIDEDQFFFLGYDCNPGGDKNNYLAGGAIQLFNLKKKIAAETAIGVDVFFIMDACRSSELPGGLPGLNFLNTAITEKRAGEMIMLATGAGQESLEDASIGAGHGLFTYYLVDGLAGAADSIDVIDNKISFDEIQQYVSIKVPLIARERFKRVQQPYFCCQEFSEKTVGLVDTAFLSNWLRLKRMQRKGPGNSIFGYYPLLIAAVKPDTTLLELYNNFSKAITEKKYSGANSAEYFYRELEQKFSGNPYTLDAGSTLAMSYINNAQSQINKLIECGNVVAATEKEECLEAGKRLENAINFVKEYDPDYANTLMANMYLLTAIGNGSNAFQNIYTAQVYSPGAAYIINNLALLHLEKNNPDSAVYYARKAINMAPNWRCSYNTLSRAYDALNLKDSAVAYKKRAESSQPATPGKSMEQDQKKKDGKIQFGVFAGGGINKFKPQFSNWKQGSVNYSDSLNGIRANAGTKFDLGIICHVKFSESLGWRPAFSLSFENCEIIYDRKNPTGEPLPETLKTENAFFNLSSPLVFKLNQNKVAPYFTGGPSFSYLLAQNKASASRLPMQTFVVSGDAGIGFDINLSKARAVLSPELRFSGAFTDMKKEARNLYTNTLSSLGRQVFLFTVSLRKK